MPSVIATLTLGDQSHDLDLTSMPTSDACDVEDFLGVDSYTEWIDDLGKFRARAVTFAWWLALKRAKTEPLPRYDEVDIDLAKLAITFRTLSDAGDTEDIPVVDDGEVRDANLPTGGGDTAPAESPSAPASTARKRRSAASTD